MESNTKQKTELTVPKQAKRRDHLFKPGQSGNPHGRPPGSVSITSAIRDRLNKVFPEKSAIVKGPDGTKIKKIKKTYLQKIVETVFENAIVTKDQRALNQIWAYIDGHPKATIDIGADKESLADLTEFFRLIGKKK